jgi:hypothetical protein
MNYNQEFTDRSQSTIKGIIISGIVVSEYTTAEVGEERQ